VYKAAVLGRVKVMKKEIDDVQAMLASKPSD
jgi:hypothetical protein